MKKLRQKFNTRLGLVLGFVLLTLTVLALPHLLAAAIGIQAAFVFTSALVDQGSGHLGDLIISHNRNGNYIKKYKKPIQPHTGAQTKYRMMLKEYAQAWQGSTVNRNLWIAAGKLIQVIGKMGATHTMTGFDMFVKYNTIAQTASPGVSLVTSPPATPSLFPLLTGITATANTGPDSVTVLPFKIGDYTTGMLAEIHASPQRSAGVSAIPKMNILTVMTPSPTAALDITSVYDAEYGPLVVGKKIFVGVRLILPTGESSPLVTSETIVTSTPA